MRTSQLFVSLAAAVAGALVTWACVSDTGSSSSDAGPGRETGSASEASAAETNIVCEPGLTACGAACVNLSNDTAHCGACKRSCGGSQAKCADGKCSAIVLASGSRFANAHGIAVDDTNVYFCVQNFDKDVQSPVAAVPKIGGEVVELAPDERTVPYVVAWQQRLYWTQWNTSRIRTVGVSPGSIERTHYEEPGPGSLFQLRATADGLFWVQNSASSKVFRQPWDAGADATAAVIAQLPSGVGGATGLWVDEQRAYFTLQSSDGAILVANLDGTPAAPLVPRGLKSPFGVTVNKTDVFFTEFGAGSVKKVAKDGKSDPVLLAVGLSGPRGIVVDGEYVYVVEWNLAGQVLRIAANPPAGMPLEAPVAMATGQSKPSDITQDTEFLYWANDDGRIMKVRK